MESIESQGSQGYGISIIIPAKNEEDYLARTLESLSQQTGVSNLEIIISVAPSTTDNSSLIAESYGCKIVEGGRPATARNNGAMAASYDILFFLDADTYLERDDFLSKELKEFSERKLEVAGTLVSHDYNGSGLKRFFYGAIFGIGNRMLLKREKTKKPKSYGMMFLKRDVFFALGGFKEGIFGEDSELAERAVRHNPSFNFGILRSCGPLKTSVRRYERDGFFKTLLKVLYLNAKAELLGYDSLKGIHDKFYKLC